MWVLPSIVHCSHSLPPEHRIIFLYFGWNSCLSHSYQHMHHLTRGGFHTVQYLAVFFNLAQRNQQKIRIKDKMQRPVWEKDKLIVYESRNVLCWLFQRLFRFELLQDLVSEKHWEISQWSFEHYRMWLFLVICFLIGFIAVDMPSALP